MRALVAAACLAAGGCGLIADDDSAWRVRADVESFDDADAACGDLDGIDQEGKSFSRTSDQPPGALSEGVHWTVTGRANADDVADCLQSNGAADVTVGEPGEQQEFEDIGP